MQQRTKENLRQSLIAIKPVLQVAGDKYSLFLSQLEALEKSLDGTEPSYDLVRSTLRAFPLEFQPTRAAMPSDQGTKATLLL
jgi:hypothetical protein